MKLVLPVWPMCSLAHDEIKTETDIPIDGANFTPQFRFELIHQIGRTNRYSRYGIADRDRGILSSMASAGARLIRKMTVKAPGTTDSRVKKECWLEANILAYANAPETKAHAFGGSGMPRAVKEIFGESIEDALGLAGIEYSKIHYIAEDSDINEDEIAYEILEQNAIVVLKNRPWSPGSSGVTAEAAQKLFDRAKFWTIPGRKPDEDGGLLRGYQFPDRIVRFIRRLREENREEERLERLAKMHSATRQRGKIARRRYFLDKVIDAFAEKIGYSRQFVTSQFLEDRVIQWLARSVDEMELPSKARDPKTLLRGRISDAVRALEFYYRTKMAMEGGGE